MDCVHSPLNRVESKIVRKILKIKHSIMRSAPAEQPKTRKMLVRQVPNE